MTKLPNTVGNSVYELLKRDIIRGELAPGSKLKLDPLKSLYTASISTLRESLNRLSSEGFVRAKEQRGFFVTDVSAADLEEIAHLRILLESDALKASIQNGDTEWEGNLVAAHHKLHVMEKRLSGGDLSEKETWKRYDWEFHLASIQACNSSNLLSLHATLYDKYLRYQMIVLTNRGEEAIEEHRLIYEAALSRDAEAAAQHLKVHIERGLEHALKAII